MAIAPYFASEMVVRGVFGLFIPALWTWLLTLPFSGFSFSPLILCVTFGIHLGPGCSHNTPQGPGRL